jgi:hypothetical protein
MGLYNFQLRFVPHIRSGRKKHTIRGRRKYPDSPGDIMHCFYGLRHPGATCVGRFPCVKREDIVVDTPYPDADVYLPWDVTVAIAGIGLGADEKERLAYADGFEDFAEMVSFWNQRLPFEGHILHWK